MAPSLKELDELFAQHDGIEVNRYDDDRQKLMVKVMDESAVGAFFKMCRELDCHSDCVTRQDLPYTVLDAWVYPD